MAYADYMYYATGFLGTAIAESDFPALAKKASAVLDQLTFGRSVTDTEYPTQIKDAMCAIAEEMHAIENSDGSEYVTSESEGSYSVSFAAEKAESRTDMQRYLDAARLWLANTSLLYAGFSSGEYGYSANDS
jgi:hypothetical protein